MTGVGGLVTKSPMTIFTTAIIYSTDLNDNEEEELKKFANEESGCK